MNIPMKQAIRDKQQYPIPMHFIAKITEALPKIGMQIGKIIQPPSNNKRGGATIIKAIHIYISSVSIDLSKLRLRFFGEICLNKC